MKMRQRISRFIVILCFVALLVPLVPESHAVYEENTGYSCLQTDSQRYAYHVILEASRRFQTEIPVNPNNQLKPEDISIVWEMICSDYPEIFWLDNYYGYEYQGEYVVKLLPKYEVFVNGVSVNASDEKMLGAIAAVNMTAEQIVSNIPAGLSDYEIALYLHDYLAKTVVYTDTPNDQTVYGALVEGKAVCAGYASAYQYLLKLAGIKSWYVSGVADNGSGDPQNHAWNLVWLDGCCYYTDVTWDDGEAGIFHEFFCVPLSKISATHQVADFCQSGIPDHCAHEDKTYFANSQGIGAVEIDSDMAAEELANYFELISYSDKEAVFRCSVLLHGAEFSSWFDQDRHSKVSKALGLNGSQCTMLTMVNETLVTISGNADNVPYVRSEAVSFTTDSITLRYVGQRYLPDIVLSPMDTSNRSYTFTSDNADVAFADPITGCITAVGAGQAVITATTADGHSTSCTVHVTLGHDHDLERFEKIDATQLESGRMMHFQCKICNAMFYDSNGIEPVTRGSDLLIESVFASAPELDSAADQPKDPISVPYWIAAVLLIAVLAVLPKRNRK